MKPRPFDYLRPDTVEEAVGLLAEYGDDACILAGGQSSLPEIGNGDGVVTDAIRMCG